MLYDGSMKRPVPRRLRTPAGPSFAAQAAQLHSFAYVARAVAFWALRMRRSPCPACRITGALGVDPRSYGVRFTCDNCDFEHLEVFDTGAAAQRPPEG